MTTNRCTTRTALTSLAILAIAGTSTDILAQETITVRGIVRDFPSWHPDFNVDRSPASVAGIASLFLDDDGVPSFRNEGKLVIEPARDDVGNPIAANLVEGPPSHGITSFDLHDGVITPQIDYAAQITVLGAAIQSGSTHLPVTSRVYVGTEYVEPFGPLTQAVSGNLNTGGDPVSYPTTVMYQAGTPISLRARSWLKKSSGYSGTQNNHWETYMDVNTSASSQQVIVLRDGDPVPAKDGFQSQHNAQAFVTDYVDFATQTMSLDSNQAIYLFELGTTNTSSSAADFQDLVVLVELADDPSYFQQVTNGAGPSTNAAVLGSDDDGGVTDDRTFRQWFRTVPGANGSVSKRITMDKVGDEYSFCTNEFFLVDGDLYGNEGMAHNSFFTFEFTSTAHYVQGMGQFILYDGDGDVMIYINNELAMELAGAQAAQVQRIDLDSLALTHGEQVDIRFFYANRNAADEKFCLRTNIDLSMTTGYRDPSTSLYD